MECRIWLLFMMAHFLCDFIIQSNKILTLRFYSGPKKLFFKYATKGNLYHSISHFIFMILFATLYCVPTKIYLKKYIIMAFIIAIIHFIIDQCKSLSIHLKQSLNDNLYIFLLDQIIHIVSIILVVNSFQMSKVINMILYVNQDYPQNLESLDRWIICIIIFIVFTYGVGVFIRKFMVYAEVKDYSFMKDKEIILKKPQDDNLGARNGGFVIGILERIFILVVVAIGQPSMVGFVLTAKSIARFKKLDDSSFAEYFLIGTFLSFIGAIIGGIIIKSLNIFPIIK